MGRRTEGHWLTMTPPMTSPNLTLRGAGTLVRLQSVPRLALKVIRRLLKDPVHVNCMGKQVWWDPSLFLCSEPGIRSGWDVGRALHSFVLSSSNTNAF